MDERSTFAQPDSSEHEARYHATTQWVLATAQEEFSDPSRISSRINHFKTAERWLQANFSQRVVDAGAFPGNMELLDGVRKEDTRLFVVMDPEDSTHYIAVNLVIFYTETNAQLGHRTPEESIVVAEDALAHLLRQWQGSGTSDGFLAIVSTSMGTSIHTFKAKEGLVSLSV